jgi:2'-5' RNA ligase
MRLFIASFLPPDTADHYDNLTAALVAEHPALRSIPRRSAHLTHAFLGKVGGLSATDLMEDIDKAVAGRPSIAIELGAPTILRAGRVPRLVMAPVCGGAAQVAALSKAVVLALRARPAFATLALAKAPHVTLARFSKQASPRDGLSVAEMLASTAPARTRSRINGVQLVDSLLTPDGPRYRTLAERRLPLSSV